MIYADFESISLPRNDRNQNPDDYYTNKYQNHFDAVLVINYYVLIIIE